jgi:hypothetical protein
MRGEGGVAGSQPMSTAVHITRHGAQINFGDLPKYLTYVHAPLSSRLLSLYIVAAPLFSSLWDLKYFKPKQRPEPQAFHFSLRVKLARFFSAFHALYAMGKIWTVSAFSVLVKRFRNIVRSYCTM